jgi:ATP/maltotriose-dependent transcriptional regulator MalT
MTGGTDGLTVYTRTKTRLQAPSSELIARPRLLEGLAGAVSAKLIVLQAPAGYGKTSLLQQWGAQLLGDGRPAQRGSSPNRR